MTSPVTPDTLHRRYTVIVDTHVGELVRRTVTGARIWGDNFVCPEQPNATTPVGHGYYYVAPDPQCPMRGCQQVTFTSFFGFFFW